MLHALVAFLYRNRLSWLLAPPDREWRMQLPTSPLDPRQPRYILIARAVPALEYSVLRAAICRSHSTVAFAGSV